MTQRTLRDESLRNLSDVQSTNRALLERALTMRAASYLAQQKASLLTQTIFELDRSKQQLRVHSLALAEHKALVEEQKSRLESRTQALEEVQRTLEERVRLRTQELEQANVALREEAAERERVQVEREQLQERYLRSQKLELVGRLAAGVAHDFNNLLTIVLGYAELARAAATEGAITEYVDGILEASTRGTALTRQLLSLAGKQPRGAGPTDVPEVIGKLSGLLRRVLGSQIELSLELDPSPSEVGASASELEQVVLNLVVNARDAIGGRGTIWVRSARTVRPDAGPAPHGPSIVLSVADDGEGMTPAVMEHAFEPFFTTKPPGMGTGLGLATVLTIVRGCGGTVEVQSHEGAGTIFSVYLPLVSHEGSVHESSIKHATPPGGHETVLVVDDEESIRVVVRQMLEMLGYRVLTGEGIDEALQVLERESVDLVLIDSMTPGDPAERLESLVAQTRPGVRMLHMSGISDLRRLDVRGRPVACIEKPFDFPQLAAAIRAALDRPQNEAAANGKLAEGA